MTNTLTPFFTAAGIRRTPIAPQSPPVDSSAPSDSQDGVTLSSAAAEALRQTHEASEVADNGPASLGHDAAIQRHLKQEEQTVSQLSKKPFPLMKLPGGIYGYANTDATGAVTLFTGPLSDSGRSGMLQVTDAWRYTHSGDGRVVRTQWQFHPSAHYTIDMNADPQGGLNVRFNGPNPWNNRSVAQPVESAQ